MKTCDTEPNKPTLSRCHRHTAVGRHAIHVDWFKRAHHGTGSQRSAALGRWSTNDEFLWRIFWLIIVILILIFHRRGLNFHLAGTPCSYLLCLHGAGVHVRLLECREALVLGVVVHVAFSEERRLDGHLISPLMPVGVPTRRRRRWACSTSGGRSLAACCSCLRLRGRAAALLLSRWVAILACLPRTRLEHFRDCLAPFCRRWRRRRRSCRVRHRRVAHKELA